LESSALNLSAVKKWRIGTAIVATNKKAKNRLDQSSIPRPNERKSNQPTITTNQGRYLAEYNANLAFMISSVYSWGTVSGLASP